MVPAAVRVTVLPGAILKPLGKVYFWGPLSRITKPVRVSVVFPVFLTWMYSFTYSEFLE